MKNSYHVQDINRAFSYGAYLSKEEALEEAKKRPNGFDVYIVTCADGRAWDLTGNRIYK